VERLFSTDAVHPRDRFDYWHEVACRTITTHDCRPACRATFQAEIESAMLAEIGLVRFTNSPMAVSHGERHVSQCETDDLFLCRQIAGSLIAEQDGRQAVLTPGDMTLLDPRLPYSARFSSGSNLLVIKLPRRALEVRIGAIRGMAARMMTSLDPVVSLTSAQVATLPAHSGTRGIGARIRCLAPE
jgi:AraC family transcriptional regulator, positive regulator of tynA and feaB